MKVSGDMGLGTGERLPLAARALLLALRGTRTSTQDGQLLDAFATVGPGPIREWARRNHVEQAVGTGLEAAGATLPEDWLGLLEANENRVSALLSAVRGLFDVLDQRGIAAAVIEAGGVLLATDIPTRAYGSGDIDILVRSDQWDRIRVAAAQSGFVPEALASGSETLPWRLGFAHGSSPGSGARVEITCAPFDRAFGPTVAHDRVIPWINRRVRSTRADGLWVLSPVDSLALVSVHTSLHAYVRPPGLRLHTDVDRIVRSIAVDWDLYLREIREIGAARRAYFSLAMAERMLGTPVPSRVLSSLSPNARLRRAVDSMVNPFAVVSPGERRMGRLAAAALDILLDERGLAAGVRGVLFPPNDWMQAHFAGGNDRVGVPRLHARRWSKVLIPGWRRG
jgi:hypothetical protein